MTRQGGSGGRSRHGDGGQGHDYDRGQRAVLGGGPTDHPCPSDRLLRSPRSKERQCHRIFEHAGGLFKGHAMLFALAAALSGSDPAQNYTALGVAADVLGYRIEAYGRVYIVTK